MTAGSYKNIWAAVPWTPHHWRRCPHRRYRKNPAVTKFLLCRGCPALRTRGQLEKVWGLPPSCTPRSVPLSSHYHRWKWAENSSPIHLPGVYHYIRCQDRQGSRQQTSQVKHRFSQTLQKSMEQQASEEEF